MALSRVAQHLPARPVSKDAKPLTPIQVEKLNAIILRGAPFDKVTYSAVLPWLKMHFSDAKVNADIVAITESRIIGIDMGKSIISNMPRRKLEHAVIYTPDGSYGIKERGLRKRTAVFLQIHFANGLHHITTVVPADKP